MFLATGVHPEVERARAAQQEIIPTLPERSTQRQHAFLDIAINNQTRGGWAGGRVGGRARQPVAHGRRKGGREAGQGPCPEDLGQPYQQVQANSWPVPKPAKQDEPAQALPFQALPDHLLPARLQAGWSLSCLMTSRQSQSPTSATAAQVGRCPCLSPPLPSPLSSPPPLSCPTAAAGHELLPSIVSAALPALPGNCL